MAKKTTARKASRSAKTSRSGSTTATGKRKATTAQGQNLKKLSKSMNPDHRKALNSTGQSRIEKLTPEEVSAFISGHKKVSPKKKWQPEPDGSIF